MTRRWTESMDPENDEPFDRSQWRRLLGADAGGPARDLDRRILAEARRALTPRVARWWLPASLATTVLLAVLIVQWQLADSVAPAHVTESDVLLTPAPIAADEAAPAAAMELPAQRQEALAESAGNQASPLIETPVPESRRAPVAEAPAAESIATAPAPAHEQVSAAKSTTDAAATLAPAPATAQMESAIVTGKFRAKESCDDPRTPEEWYADIKALRAAGQIKEADAELACLKTIHPDWLERHQ